MLPMLKTKLIDSTLLLILYLMFGMIILFMDINVHNNREHNSNDSRN